jgi:hypothetical protein
VTKELRNLGRLKNEMSDISELIVTKCLDDLWNIEEREIHRVLFHNSNSVLQNCGFSLVCCAEEGCRKNRGNRSPEKHILRSKVNLAVDHVSVRSNLDVPSHACRGTKKK